MKDKIYKSFEEWFNKEDFHANGYDCNQVVSAKLAWSARNAEIQELKYKIKKLRNYYNCKHNCFNVDDCISSKHFKCDKWEIFE